MHASALGPALSCFRFYFYVGFLMFTCELRAFYPSSFLPYSDHICPIDRAVA
jgi:hypothetical protein